ncbi:hypothetical protein [Haloarchaeobius iranensis]|uniref:Lipoprotein n=1 Tax=Haloarchaeobius iranensis TaxID=996166 RepID=A0A1G9W638_9EURY|nr:hypothetical protein [Haloarchaeobius iranensis]SDM79773.1 hypothetical protein SAMN05192554_107167 [Haloarchaeobius iranensis]
MARGTLVLVVLTVLLAGCVGGVKVDDGATTVATTSSSGTGSGGGGSGGGGSGGSSADLEPGSWNVLEFGQPATYTYDIFVEGDGEGSLVLDVQEVDGDSITVRAVYELGQERHESTVTGTKETVQSQLYANPAGILLLTTMLTPSAWYGGQELEVGSGWSYQTQAGSASFEVTGVETYAGVDCFDSEMVVDGTTLHEGCFSPGLGLAPYTAYYDEDGSLSMEMALVSYEPN